MVTGKSRIMMSVVNWQILVYRENDEIKTFVVHICTTERSKHVNKLEQSLNILHCNSHHKLHVNTIRNYLNTQQFQHSTQKK